MDEGLRIKTRESWYQKCTNAVLALNQLVKDLQLRHLEDELQEVQEVIEHLRNDSKSSRVVSPNSFQQSPLSGATSSTLIRSESSKNTA